MHPDDVIDQQIDPTEIAITHLIAMIRIVVPLAAAAQLQRLWLHARVMDYLGDMHYCLSSMPEAQEVTQGWIASISRVFTE